MARKKSIHRALIFRLAITTLLLALILGTVVVVFEFDGIYDRVTERSFSAAEHLRWLIIEHLGPHGFTDKSKIKEQIQKLANESTRSPEGSFVFTRILDLDFNEVVMLSNNKYHNIKSVVAYGEKNLDRLSLVYHGYWRKMQLIGDDTVIYLGTELKNSANVRVGYIDGIYVVAPSFIAKAKWSAVITGLSVIGIVFLTTLLLYPVIVRLFRRVCALSSRLLEANMEILNTLGNVISKQDPQSEIHNYRVAIYAVRTAEVLELDQDVIRVLIKGAFLHDVRKLDIADNILLKSGKLTAAEFDAMKKHVAYGADVIAKSSRFAEAIPINNQQHDKHKITDVMIQKITRIFALVDVFDVLTANRPYKRAIGFEDAIEILEASKGSYFDQDILEAFFSIAHSLYDEYASCDDEKIREDICKIISTYFTPEDGFAI